MTQIFTGEGLGLQGSSLKLGKYGPQGSATLGQGGEAVYVNAANGNLVLQQTDGFLADMGFGLDLFQTYNSRGESSAAWCFNLQSRLKCTGEPNQEHSLVTRIDEDGHNSVYIFDVKKQAYIPQGGGTASITYGVNGWIYKEGSQKTSSVYNYEGKLCAIYDLDGHSILFNYANNQLASIVDNSGKQKIVWSFAQGLLKEVTTTSDGIVVHKLHYDYDEQQRLHKVSRDLAQGKTFWITYDYVGDSTRISDIKQADGTNIHIDYDAQSRVKKLIDGEGRISVYDYQAGKTLVTNGLGEAWTFYYDEDNKLTGVDGPEQYRIRYYYEGALLSRVIQKNQIWQFSYNEAGDCINIQEPSGQITQITYDAAHHMLSETQYQTFDGNHLIKPQTVRYVYDARGHLLFTLTATGTVTEYRYDEQGQLISSRSYLAASYEVSLLQPEELVSIAELQAWIARQNCQAVSLTDYRYDWRGQLIEEIQYAQVDLLGQGILADALISRSRYDAAGRLVEKSKPINNKWFSTHYIYDDLGRLIQTIDSQNHSQRIEYDDDHQRVIQTDANGLQTIRLYDHSGLLLATTQLDVSHTYGTISYKYDKAGRLIAQTGIDKTTCYTFYDQQGRIQAQVNTRGQLTENLYNEQGLLIKTRQYEQAITTTGWLEQLPDYALIRLKKSPNDRINQIIYNQNNQVLFRIDAEGAVICYQYNAQEEVILTVAYAQRLVQFNPEEVLTLETIRIISTPTRDRVVFYYYDQEGRLEAQINAEGYATAYNYDRLGNLIHTCRYFNPIAKAYSGNWLQDKPVEVARKDIHIYSLYDARGLKVADIDGEKYVTEYRYDSQGLLQEKYAYEQEIPWGTLIDETTTLEQIRPAVQNNDHQTVYQYNELGLLVQEKNQAGLVTTYAYNELGQVVTKNIVDAKTQAARQQNYRYDILGRVIQSLDALGSALLQQGQLSIEQIELIWQKHSMRYGYNAAGLLSTKTNALNQTMHYFYDEDRALRFTVNADGAITETQYTVFGQVAATRKFSNYLKINLSGLSTIDLAQHVQHLQNNETDEFTYYKYNTIGQLIAESHGKGSLITNHYTAFGELEDSRISINSNHSILTKFAYDKRGLLTECIEDAEHLARTTGMQYDAFGWVIKKTDGKANAMQYKLNNRGERLWIVNPSNQFKTISYDAYGRILDETDYTHSIVVKEFSYDDKNQSFVFTNPDAGVVITTQCNAFGDKLSITDSNSFTTDFYYNELGQVTRINSPELAFKEYHYDKLGRLIWQQNAENQVIQYSYDASDHLLVTTIDPDTLKIATSYQYDGIGRQLQVTEPNGCIKQFNYDTQGNLVRTCIEPQGLNLITEFFYDERGLLVRQNEINPLGVNKSRAYVWDNLGRKIATIVDPEGLNLVTSYQYDANDNLICQTDANQHSTRYIYDVNNQCRYQINARGVVTEHIYNILGDEIQTTIYAKPIASLLEYTEVSLKTVLVVDSEHDYYQFNELNGVGKIIVKFDALGYATSYGYDKNGNLVTATQYSIPQSLEALKKGSRAIPLAGDKRQENFVYDGLNQLRFTIKDGGYVTENYYDKNGQLIRSTKYSTPISLAPADLSSVTNISNKLKIDAQYDQSVWYAYDKAGRLAAELNTVGTLKAYVYDKLGKIISSTIYATRIATVNLTSINSFNFLNVTTNTPDRITQYVYDAAGRERYRISSEGQVLERRYDAVGNIVAQLTHAISVQLAVYTEETIKNALSTQEKQARLTSYTYDATGRLASEVNSLHNTTKYTYDAQGNVASKTQANQAIWTYKYDEANQLIETQAPATLLSTAAGQLKHAVITRNTYDSFGNLTSIVRDAEGLQQTQFFVYDARNYKIKTIYPNVTINYASAVASNERQEIAQHLVEETQYNAFGEVIATSDKAGNWKHFTYDFKGLLTYSVDTQGELIRYKYNNLNQLIKKISYATPFTPGIPFDYTTDAITTTLATSVYDREESYSYNKANQLLEVSRNAVRTYNPRTNHYDVTLKPTTQYTYNAFGDVTKVSVKVNELEWADTYTYYDKEGRKTAVIDAEGYLTSYRYNVLGELEAMTEHAIPADNWTTENYILPLANHKDRTVLYTYDALGQLKTKVLKQVRIERLIAGNNTYETITKDLSTAYTYDALGHLTATKDAKGNIAYCYYNELGQVIAKIAPSTQAGTGAITYAYDGLGRLVATNKWAQGVLQADETHFILKGASSQDILSLQEYDNLGRLTATTDGLQHKIFYSYDANGKVARSWQTLKQVDDSSVIQDKRFIYDKAKNLVNTITLNNNGILHTEDAKYNTFGELIAKGNNGQFTTHLEYDALGRVWRSNSQGYYQIYLYDLTDHVTQIVSSSNNFREENYEYGVDLSLAQFEDHVRYDLMQYTFDLQRQNNTYNKLGHLLKQSKEYSVNFSATNKNVHLEYANQAQTVDRWGNMLSFTNALGFETCYAYNAFNQVINQELPQVKVVNEHGVSFWLKPVNKYAYDELGQCIAMLDANGHMVSKAYDALGHVLFERDAQGNVRHKNYNLLEQLATSTNELGGITYYTYDKANRLLALATTQTNQLYAYDEAGQLIKQTNGAGEAISFWYDTLGQQIQRRDARGYDTKYQYDAAGRKILETDAEGHSLSWGYNGQGKLTHHVDLGGHSTVYSYNTNGLLLEESSTAGKHTKYHYQGDGSLLQYVDESLGETVNYWYDAAGQMLSKETGKGKDLQDGWLRETDHYVYDALGRLSQVRRRNPQDTDKRFPEKDKALLSIDYEYDTAGNIRHTQVSANYTGYEKLTSDDYYVYDENNRITVNKGRLVNGQIVINNTQGSTTTYDAAGNIQTAARYENGAVQNYRYTYTTANQLLLTQKNGLSIQAKYYDKAGRVIQEHSFNSLGQVSQKNIMAYVQGMLSAQSVHDSTDFAVLHTNYAYDKVGNLQAFRTEGSIPGNFLISIVAHTFTYALWENYQQELDDFASWTRQKGWQAAKSTRSYDVNGQLQATQDGQNSATTYYLNSAVEGLKGRRDKEGQTGYLTVAGKTIGDIQLDNKGKQHLTVYGGFTPTGSQQPVNDIAFGWKKSGAISSTNTFLNRAPGDKADGTLPEAPQDNLGTYTVQQGDTLEQIALHLYGDSSLWYLLADANGITDKNAQAGSSGQLHVGQRITIPAASSSQNHTYATHKLINPNHLAAKTKASALTAPAPIAKSHHSLFASLVVGIIAVVATVMTAGVLGALAGMASEAGGLFALGGAVLGGSAAGASTALNLGIGFAAGFLGNLAAQGAGTILGTQTGMNIKGALINGLATAATGGIIKGINSSTSYQTMLHTADNLVNSPVFSMSSAAQLMEQNAISQGINLSLQKHQHFAWEELASAGLAGGLMGSPLGHTLNTKLNTLDKTGILSSELNALTQAGTQSATTGAHFNAAQVLSDNLGSAVGNALVETKAKQEMSAVVAEADAINGLPEEADSVSSSLEDKEIDSVVYADLTRLKLKELEEETSGYCPFDKNEKFSPLPKYFHELKNRLNAENIIFDNLLENLAWDASEHGLKRFTKYSFISLEDQGLSLKSDYILDRPLAKYDYYEALDIQMNLKGSSSPKIAGGGKRGWINASKEQVREAMQVEKLFAHPVKRMQFLDLHYQEGVSKDDLNSLLKGMGRLENKGAVFLKASKDFNISPLYLVGHAIFESGKGVGPLAEQNNFFGMAAYDKVARKAGTKFAKDHGWTTPELGIRGAAQIISQKWINNPKFPQKTLYDMRWNSQNPGQKQYATDIYWATSQTHKLYKTVMDMKQINPAYLPHFIVPVYLPSTAIVNYNK